MSLKRSREKPLALLRNSRRKIEFINSNLTEDSRKDRQTSQTS